MWISIVVPVKNEQDSLRELVERIGNVICDQLSADPKSCELVFVDDGSADESWEVIRELVGTDYGLTVKAVRFRRNFGKALALSAGFGIARGRIVFTMDADLQDEPKEIPRFLEKLEEGYDLISGWKRRRHDPLSKTLPSKIFNGVTAWFTGVKLHDFNCGYKCYRREVIQNINVYGELHRFMPVLAADLGYRVGELEVLHHPRKHGASKYGWERYLRGGVDLVTVLATTRWLNKPGHLFGGVGIVMGIVGGGSLLYLLLLWLFGTGPIGGRPLLMFGILLSILSVQMISLGVIAEFFVRMMNPRSIQGLIAERSGCDAE